MDENNNSDNFIDLNNLFDIIDKNINDSEFIEYMIDYIKNNFINIDYEDFINKIILSIDNDLFIINFVNILINKMSTHRKLILHDLIIKINNNKILSDLCKLDYFGFENLYNIFKFKNFSIKDNYSLINTLFIYGKFDIIDKLLDFIYKTNINNDILTVIIISIIYFINKNFIHNDYIKIINKINKILFDIIYPLFELNNILNETLQLELTLNLFTNNDKINIINKYYLNLFDKNLIDDILIKQLYIHINILIRNDKIEYIYDLCDRMKYYLSNDKLNIHEKTILFIKICTYLTNDKYEIIPEDIIQYINYYLSNVKFLDWSNFDEKINIIMIISKILLKLYQKNLIKLNKKNDEELLYNIIENVLLNNITYTNYTLIKESVYGLINVLNIFVEVQISLLNFNFNNNNDCDCDYIFYKLNINLSSYILFLLKSKELYKFNFMIMINNFIVSKLIILNEQMNKTDMIYIGLEYEKIYEFYNNKFIKISNNFIEKLDFYKNKLDEDNKYIDNNPDLELIDNIFSIKIKNSYRLPKSNESYERCTLRLLIKESGKNPLTRELLTLNELDNYNS